MILLLLSLVFNSDARAEALLGHNLTPTTTVLGQGQVMAGSYALAVGVTDQLTIGTSPWLIWQYNMPALSTRYSFALDGYIQRLTIEQLYFKTFRFGFDMYEQESTWTRVTISHRYDHFYTVHANLGFQYFIDDKVPFSMRPVPINHTPITWSASTLQELHFSEHWGTFVETGLLAFNYPNRYAHVGLSGFYQWAGGYAQLGLSKTIPIGPDEITLDQYQIWQNSEGQWRSSVYRKSPSPIHPEIQVQIML